MGRNIGILNGKDFIDMFALDPFGGYRGGGDGGSTSKCFEFGFLNVAVVVYFDLKLDVSSIVHYGEE